MWVLPFLNNSKDLDPSYKMDLDFKDCSGMQKALSYNQRNTVIGNFNVSYISLITRRYRDTL